VRVQKPVKLQTVKMYASTITAFSLVMTLTLTFDLWPWEEPFQQCPRTR